MTSVLVLTLRRTSAGSRMFGAHEALVEVLSYLDLNRLGRMRRSFIPILDTYDTSQRVNQFTGLDLPSRGDHERINCIHNHQVTTGR